MPRFRYEAVDMANRSHSGSQSGVEGFDNAVSYAVSAVGSQTNLKSVTLTRVEPLVVELTEAERDWVLSFLPREKSAFTDEVDIVRKIKSAKPRSY